jgi:phosphoribosyl 1,2-cyclic phosphate phosphodiesterase
MKLTILGCGTSTGVPMIGCHCEVCASSEERNKRLRASVFIETVDAQGEKRNILIDTSTDLRAQALAAGIERIDSVIFTHPHADHVHGVDDLRIFNVIQKTPIPCYGDEATLARIKTLFGYIFNDDVKDGWKPQLGLNIIDGPFDLFGLRVTPIKVEHGNNIIYTYRFGDLAYMTDCSGVSLESKEQLGGLKVLILDALRKKPHFSHFNLDQAIAFAQELKAERTIFTHLSHKLDYKKDAHLLPKGMEFAYDGMVVEG